MEAQLKTMPDDIINLVLEFMPSYLKDIKIIKIVKENIFWENFPTIQIVGLDELKKIWFHNRAKDGIGNSIYTFEYIHKNTIYNFNQLDKPLYPLPVSPYAIGRKEPDGCRWYENSPYIIRIKTNTEWNGEIKLHSCWNRDNNSSVVRRSLYPKKLQDYYTINQLNLIAEFYGLKVPSKFKKNKTKYIQYLMKQEY